MYKRNSFVCPMRKGRSFGPWQPSQSTRGLFLFFSFHLFTEVGPHANSLGSNPTWEYKPTLCPSTVVGPEQRGDLPSESRDPISPFMHTYIYHIWPLVMHSHYSLSFIFHLHHIYLHILYMHSIYPKYIYLLETVYHSHIASMHYLYQPFSPSLINIAFLLSVK